MFSQEVMQPAIVIKLSVASLKMIDPILASVLKLRRKTILNLMEWYLDCFSAHMGSLQKAGARSPFVAEFISAQWSWHS